jgi:hypothetical protein
MLPFRRVRIRSARGGLLALADAIKGALDGTHGIQKMLDRPLDFEGGPPHGGGPGAHILELVQEGEKIAGYGHDLATGEAGHGRARTEGQDVAHCGGLSPETVWIRQGERAALNMIGRPYPLQTGRVVDFPWPLRIGGGRTDLHVARDLDGHACGLTMPRHPSSGPRPAEAGSTSGPGRLQDSRCA